MSKRKIPKGKRKNMAKRVHRNKYEAAPRGPKAKSGNTGTTAVVPAHDHRTDHTARAYEGYSPKYGFTPGDYVSRIKELGGRTGAGSGGADLILHDGKNALVIGTWTRPKDVKKLRGLLIKDLHTYSEHQHHDGLDVDMIYVENTNPDELRAIVSVPDMAIVDNLPSGVTVDAYDLAGDGVRALEGVLRYHLAGLNTGMFENEETVDTRVRDTYKKPARTIPRRAETVRERTAVKPTRTTRHRGGYDRGEEGHTYRKPAFLGWGAQRQEAPVQRRTTVRQEIKFVNDPVYEEGSFEDLLEKSFGDAE